MKISLIAAIGKKRQLGLKNKLLWQIREDFKYFKKTTWGHCLIMGRRTYESIGRPLPGRKTIVLTRNSQEKFPGVLKASSKKEAVFMASKQGDPEIFVCGGGEIYAQFLENAHKLYLTRVDFEGEADTFFPPFEHLEAKLIRSEKFPGTEQSLGHRQEVFEFARPQA